MDGKPTVKTFACPTCQASISIRGLGQTTTVACASCGSIIDITNDSYKLLRTYQKALKKPLLPLGIRGTFEDTKYEIIGFMMRCDRTGGYHWDEYLLFNPYKGFAWLVKSAGHWTFLVMTKDNLGKPATPEITYNNQVFKHFLWDSPKVEYVIGEFYWEVAVGDKVDTRDYVSPPFILSCEKSSDEIVWSYGEYLYPYEVEKAFELETSLPSPRGVAPNEPNPWKERALLLTPLCVVFIILAIILHNAVTPSVRRSLLQQSFTFDRLNPSAANVSTTEFQVLRERTNLAVGISAPVNNSWIDLDLTLVNLDTNERREVSTEVAYYQGSDSDGAWSEGNTFERYYFSAVEPGRYYLTASPTTDPTISKLSYSISVMQGVSQAENLGFAIFALLVGPLLCVVRYSFFETQRWQQSDKDEDE